MRHHQQLFSSPCCFIFCGFLKSTCDFIFETIPKPTGWVRSHIAPGLVTSLSIQEIQMNAATSPPLRYLLNTFSTRVCWLCSIVPSSMNEFQIAQDYVFENVEIFFILHSIMFHDEATINDFLKGCRYIQSIFFQY